MRYSKLAWGALALATGLGLGACGGGTGTATTSGKSVSVGTITGFGSVYVNGCEYETDSADIYVEGYISSEDSLSVGDVVEVTGPTNCTQGNATSIKFADDLEGVVDSASITSGVGTMVVMGQNVTVNNLTTFENDILGNGLTIDDLDTNHIIEISGLGIGTGDIVATRIELKALSLADYLADPEHNYIEIKGVVSAHNGTDQFNIGNLVVDYGSHPAILDGMSAISNDLYVEVKATSYSTNGAAPYSIVATEVEREDDGKIGYQGDDNEDFEIKGMLTAAYDPGTKLFGINDQMVLVNDNTDFQDEDDHPAPIMTLISNSANTGKLYFEVEGRFNANGVLVAKEVELEDDDITDDSETTGLINAITSTGGNNNGTLTVNGMTFTVTNNTIMEDDSDANQSKFNFTYLGTGDRVEVYYDATSLVAIKVERKNP